LITLSLISDATQLLPVSSFSKVRKALESDSVAYALFCQKYDLEYETEDRYLQLVQEFYRCGASKLPGSQIWIDSSLQSLVQGSISIPVSEAMLSRLCDEAQQAFTDGRLLRPVALRPEAIRLFLNHEDLVGSDCFYHDFYDAVAHVPLIHWVEKGYHQTFEKGLKYHSAKLSLEWMIAALENGCMSIVKTLLEAGFRLRGTGPHGQSFISYAIRSQEPTMVSFLLSQGVIVDRGDLLLAIDLHQDDVVVLLLNHSRERADLSIIKEALLQCGGSVIEATITPRKRLSVKGP